MPPMNTNEWLYSTTHTSPCRLLEENELWGNITCQVWLQKTDTIVTVPKNTLEPLSKGREKVTPYHIRYLASAAKIADILDRTSEGGGILLAPIESSVIPLPHQITALTRALSEDRIRYLLADEVGLGKTIEAGLILKELKLRGRVKRILVVSPKGLTEQWVSEMKTHFNEDFSIVLPEDIRTLKKVTSATNQNTPDTYGQTRTEINPWTVFSQVITSMDSVKPLERRKGWSKERVDTHNKDRFGDLISAGWDLVIIDESHRLGGSTDLVARHKLGKGLAECTPYLLLLSATPHQGKSDAFFRLISLLDPKMFPAPDIISRETVEPYVIRTVKRNAIDAMGNPLFKPRTTTLHPVRWEEHHHRQEELYNAVTEYIKIGYNEAISDNKQYIGFLMVLMQRLVVSSTAAIERTLERRLDVLSETCPTFSQQTETYQSLTEEEIYDLDGQHLLETLLERNDHALTHESENVRTLLDLARECRQTGPDVKTEALLDLIFRLRQEEQSPDLKILIFTEFIPTQEMLHSFLQERGFTAEILNGTMSLEERNRAQTNFMEKAQFLISTDAGGEGLNLQFCHVVVNYDIPWNPMRLEQRIGRVDRIGQAHRVKAINFVFENSVEFRVREVLEEKLAVIYEEFGIDKTGDVLDSAIAGQIFENLFIEAIISPDTINTSVDQAVGKIQDELQDIDKNSVITQISDIPNTDVSEKIRGYPFPSWIENMTIAYLLSHQGKIIKRLDSCSITWPDGTEYRNAIFSESGIGNIPGVVHLTPEETHIKELITTIPEWSPGILIPHVWIPELPADIRGYWGLFEVGFSYEKPILKSDTLRFIPAKKRAFMPVFISEDGKMFRQTARFIWDSLLSHYYEITTVSDQKESQMISRRLMDEAKISGREFYNELQEQHLKNIQTEEMRAERSFHARKTAIEQLGLDEVRSYRLRELRNEQHKWKKEIASAGAIIPKLRPVVMIRIQKSEN